MSSFSISFDRKVMFHSTEREFGEGKSDRALTRNDTYNSSKRKKLTSTVVGSLGWLIGEM